MIVADFVVDLLFMRCVFKQYSLFYHCVLYINILFVRLIFSRRRSNQVFVANHTSMIDFIVLEQLFSFAVIMQVHKGWVGFLQKTVMRSLGCIEFNRTESKDRHVVAQRYALSMLMNYIQPAFVIF